MQKQLTQLAFKIADKVYHFICDPNSPLDHVKEALFQFTKYVGAIQDAIKAQQDQNAQAAELTQTSESKIEPIQTEVA